MKAKEVEEQALKLRPKQRARLASTLLGSLGRLSEADLEVLWREEAARRDAEADADPSVELPVDEVLREIRRQLR